MGCGPSHSPSIAKDDIYVKDIDTRISRPRDLRVTGGTCRELSIQWEGESSNVDYHEIYITSQSDDQRKFGGIVTGKDNTLTIRDLLPATEYEIEVTSVIGKKSSGEIKKSEPTTLKTSTGPYIENLRTKKITDRSLEVRWYPAIGEVDHYAVTHSGPDNVEIEDAYLDEDTTTYKLESLDPGVMYTVSVTPQKWDPRIIGDAQTIRVKTDDKFEEKRALKEHIRTIVDGETIQIQVDRTIPVWGQCKEIYRNKEDLRLTPEVSFKDSHRTYDLGGPRREFLTLIIDSIMTGYKKDDDDELDVPMLLFEGEEDHKVLTHDEVLLEKGTYGMAGRMLQHSIIWGGPGLAGLAQSVKEFVQTGTEYVTLHVDDVPDTDCRLHLQMIIDCSATELSTLGNDVTTINLLVDAGINGTPMNINNKDVLLQEILLHQIVRCRLRELKQFREGFDCLSLIQFLKHNPGALEIIFPKHKDSITTYCQMCPLIKFKPRDSADKKQAAQNFMKYLQECEHRQTTGSGGVIYHIIQGSSVHHWLSRSSTKVVW
uniref:G2/M phase-specific E3 ubiquitin-protein ligase-like n=1 Tax=Saccoglossus kowalevskii TaxID=10224 RepID=A0ABM0GNA0_SACKO|nr:PREDICTED: G2/M phase-specific E3 ubiquitin-protein ligase-like [Saccoglossus kowalevskii]